jgi:hypothetical protein
MTRAGRYSRRTSEASWNSRHHRFTKRQKQRLNFGPYRNNTGPVPNPGLIPLLLDNWLIVWWPEVLVNISNLFYKKIRNDSIFMLVVRKLLQESSKQSVVVGDLSGALIFFLKTKSPSTPQMCLLGSI